MNQSQRYILLNLLTHSVFRKEEERKEKFIGDLIEAHIIASNNGTLAFRHRGEVYYHPGATHRNVGTRIERLHSSLRSKLDDFLKHEEMLVGEVKPMIMAYFRTCTLTTLNLESLEKLLPRTVHPTLHEWHEKAPTDPRYEEDTRVVPQEEIDALMEKYDESIKQIKGFKARALVMS